MMEEWKEPDTTCAGCGDLLPGEQVAFAHILGALGLVAERVHRETFSHCATLACAKHREQPAKLIAAPVSKVDKMRAQVERRPPA